MGPSCSRCFSTLYMKCYGPWKSPILCYSKGIVPPSCSTACAITCNEALLLQMKVARYYLNLVWQVRMLAMEGKRNAVRKEHET